MILEKPRKGREDRDGLVGEQESAGPPDAEAAREGGSERVGLL